MPQQTREDPPSHLPLRAVWLGTMEYERAFALQQRLERLLRFPFRMLRRHRFHAIKGEGHLEIERHFAPQCAVIVEGGDALRHRHEILAARRRHALTAPAVFDGSRSHEARGRLQKFPGEAPASSG